MKKLSLIVPVYNEEKTIEAVLGKLANLSLGACEKEIIVVDDGSIDNSPSEILRYAQDNRFLKIVRHEKNQGKGAAVKSGLTAATGDHVLIQDADLEYDPADIPLLLNAAEINPGAVIYGSRNLKPKRRGYWHYVLGVKILTDLTNLLFGTNLTDIYTGYKLFPTPLLRNLELKSRGFEFEAEVTTTILKQKIRILEVPINYYPRSFAEGKKIGFLDGLKGLWTIVKHKYT